MWIQLVFSEKFRILCLIVILRIILMVSSWNSCCEVFFLPVSMAVVSSPCAVGSWLAKLTEIKCTICNEAIQFSTALLFHLAWVLGLVKFARFHLFFHTLSGSICNAVDSYAEGCWFDSRKGCSDLYCANWAQGVRPWPLTASQLDLLSLTPS